MKTFNIFFGLVLLSAVSSFSFAQTPKQQPKVKESVAQVKQDFNTLKNLFKKKGNKEKDKKEAEQVSEKKEKELNPNDLHLDETIVQKIVQKIEQVNEGEKIEITEVDESITVSVQFDWGNTFTEFSKLKSRHVFGDLGNDGSEDAVIQAIAYSGGNSEHLILYVLSKISDEWQLLFDVNASDEQLKGCDKGKFYPKKIENGFLIGESLCFKDSDARCCPSLKFRTTVKLESDRLISVKKEKI